MRLSGTIKNPLPGNRKSKPPGWQGNKNFGRRVQKNSAKKPVKSDNLPIEIRTKTLYNKAIFYHFAWEK